MKASAALDDLINQLNYAESHILEASIAELLDALHTGTVSSTVLVAAYLRRIAFYSRHGLHLNAVPVLNIKALAEAAESDKRRRCDRQVRPLEGIPFVVKDSYSVSGLTVANGSPAFKDLYANRDATVVRLLRDAGAIMLGKTTMPPMAYGGMERGLYGRSESPYNLAYLPAAYGSGSSQGSAVATTAAFAAFALGEETVSSGRSPASNNSLVAYTPSRGVIPMTGNWPLYPTCDVVVPYTKTVADMLILLNVITRAVPNSGVDFWRDQSIVSMSAADELRNTDYRLLQNPDWFRGKRIGVPKMYIGTDELMSIPITIRESIRERWLAARAVLCGLGASIVETDFPVVSNYERDRPGARTMYDRGLVPAGWQSIESCELIAYGWEGFLQANGDPNYPSLKAIDPHLIFPTYPGTIDKPDMVHGRKRIDFEKIIKAAGRYQDLMQIPNISHALKGLERTRQIDFECWLDSNRLDCIVFPANADIAQADSDVNPRSHALAWRNGTCYSNGNRVLRHLGIPTVTIPMGLMRDTQMPVGLTFAGRAYEDCALLQGAYAFENASPWHQLPQLTPPLRTQASYVSSGTASPNNLADSVDVAVKLFEKTGRSNRKIKITHPVNFNGPSSLVCFVNGQPTKLTSNSDEFETSFDIQSEPESNSIVQNPKAEIASVITLFQEINGACSGDLKILE